MELLPLQALGVGATALAVAFLLFCKVKAAPEGNEAMARIARYIREGALAFLMREYKVLSLYALIVFALLFYALGSLAAVGFLGGAFLSLLAGFFGMKTATLANVRTAEAARTKGKPAALLVALDGGAVMGFCVSGLGLIGLGILFGLYRHRSEFPYLIHAFAVGASSIALFARIGGGIYTKAADVGADIVGKVEANIPEDDPRNPGVIADNVGDNVGDIAGMGADIYESYVATIVAAMALGLTLPVSVLQPLVPLFMDENGLRVVAVALPLFLATIGLAVSVVGGLITRMMINSPPATVLRFALILPPLLVVLVAAAALSYYHISWVALITLGIGAIGGVAVGLITDYYTSMAPIRKVAESALTGPGTNVICGIAVGLESVAAPLVTLCIVGSLANAFLGLYGIALAAVGMLSTAAMVMTVDAYGPIADNAGGISEMSGLGKEVRDITDELDSVGNTTAAIGKGFAIGSALLTVVALFAAFSMEVNAVRRAHGEPEMMLVLTDSRVLMGLLFGSLLPCVVGATTMTAVGRAAGAIVEEIRRQFREIPGLLEGQADAEPQPARIVDLATSAAIKQMILPGAVAVLSPVLIGFWFGPEVLAGALVGSLAVGATLSLMMANAGGAWDNAKKYLEKGGLPGHLKGSDAHKAAVVGDTVGDPFKDAAGPGISILIKVMGVVSLMIAPLIA
ncbi:sodium-translocating pyrophosphatase [Pajaroellobacter abortibovis]|uniref:Putative K(+)-stimulated pyrophosphate-energized sodium pump n=1 Tax=Pajaroellobacter abortibovis TaxID=1882918 RepID=A0A1L6MZB9_9BACT|nr:sodium-translocating pyrophosphatase [Pajaroellobacter abortibovis]APS00747.1 sodium-translocating pyrophosphatase [Pajaroellobacter abortibovis]